MERTKKELLHLSPSFQYCPTCLSKFFFILQPEVSPYHLSHTMSFPPPKKLQLLPSSLKESSKILYRILKDLAWSGLSSPRQTSPVKFFLWLSGWGTLNSLHCLNHTDLLAALGFLHLLFFPCIRTTFVYHVPVWHF